MLCEYGCGKKAYYQLKNGKWCCCKSPNSCSKNREKNSIATRNSNKNRDYKKQYNTLPQETKDRMAWNRGKLLKPIEEYLKNNSMTSNEKIKKIILENNLLEYKCSCCGITVWNNKPIHLELHHIDGNNTNNSIDNVCFLCPNCHSQTETFRGRNINSGKTKVSDEDIIEAYKQTQNIRQTLIIVGLAPKGGNYSRVKRIIKKENI